MPSPIAAASAALVLLLASVARGQDPLTFERAVELAMTRNERAESAAARSQAANARVARARAFFFPELAVSGTYTRRSSATERQIGSQNVVIQRRDALSANAAVRMSLFDARGIPLYRQASVEADAARLEAIEETWRVGFETGEAFLMTLGAEQVRAAAARRLEFANRNFRDAQARFEAQLVSSNDVTRARLEVASAERELARAAGELESAYLHLGLLVATDVKGPLKEPQALLSASQLSPEEARKVVEGRAAKRPDVQAEKAHAEAARLFAQEPFARLFPALGLFGQYRLTNEAGLSGRVADGFLGVELAWTLFDGGERYAELDERRSLTRAAAAQARGTERQAVTQAKDAVVSLGSSQAALRQAKVASDVARRNSEETQELYRQGLSSALEVADANLQLFVAEVALARERYGQAVAFLNVRAAAGVDPLGKEAAR
jgi:outer membrane protein TolC